MKAILGVLFLLLTVFILGACATPGAFKDLSPAQIDSVVKDKSVFGNCTIVVGPGWTAKSSTLTVDKGVVGDGGVAIDPNTCGMTYTNNRAPARTVTPGAGNATTTTIVAPTTTTIQTPGHTITERPQ